MQVQNVMEALLLLEEDARALVQVAAPEADPSAAARRIALVARESAARLDAMERANAQEQAEKLAAITQEYAEKMEALEVGYAENRATQVAELVRWVLFGEDDAWAG